MIPNPIADRSGAVFSKCRKYRYELTRVWNPVQTPRMAHFCMLNPSTADHVENDATVERCRRRADMLGYDGLIVTNIFAWRSTDPAALYSCQDPIGPENDGFIRGASYGTAITICGWGGHGALNGRGKKVELMLRRASVKLHYLKFSESTGMPWHPLYVGYKVQPQEWKAVQI